MNNGAIRDGAEERENVTTGMPDGATLVSPAEVLTALAYSYRFVVLLKRMICSALSSIQLKYSSPFNFPSNVLPSFCLNTIVPGNAGAAWTVAAITLPMMIVVMI